MRNDHPVAITLSMHAAGGQVTRHTITRDIIKIGRGSQSHVCIADDGVARMHAVIEVQALDEITLIDLGNGTTVNGARVNKCKLKPGDEIGVGHTTLRIETVMHAAAERVAAAMPIADPNPFMAREAQDPFTFAAMRGVATSVDEAAPEGSYEYRVLKSAPDVAADECETQADAVSIKLSWGRNVLSVAHIDANGNYWLGETEDGALRCDYFVPASKLGTPRAPVVLGGQVVLLPDAHGSVAVAGKPPMSLADARATASPCSEFVGAHCLPLANGTVVTMHIDDMVLEICGEKRGRKSAAAFSLAALAGGAAAYVLASFVGHAGLLAAMASFYPPLGATESDTISDEQRTFLLQHMDQLAQLEQDAREDENLSDTTKGNEGGQGMRAKGEEGSMGDSTSKATDGRYSVRGPVDNPDPHISQARALEEARSFGAIGLLASLDGADAGPIADWARLEALGNDPLSFEGNMWNEQIGTSFGAGGLGLTGIGMGGGGFGEGIGLDGVGTIGHGAGGGNLMGFGPGGGHGLSRNRIARQHKATSPNVRIAGTSVSGRLPPEVIQRIVRQNYGRFRACYESGLRTNPNLQGRVVASFVIGRDGTVANVSGGGDLPDSGVISCVTRSFYGLTFPQPDGGIVTVTYPIVLSPAS